MEEPTLDDPETDLRPATRMRYVVLAAACAVALVTYIHRLGFAVGAPELKTDLHLNDDEMGRLLTAFFLAYGGFQILGGWLGDRWGTRSLLTLLVFGWSLVTGALALVVYMPNRAAQLTFLLVLRFLFGMFQAGGFPLLSRITADWMPVTLRGTAQGLIWMASRMGGAVIPLMLVPMFHAFGTWRTPFWVLAAIGFVWCAAFWPWFRNTPEESPWVNREELALITKGRKPREEGRHHVPWRALMSSRSAWGVCFAYGFSGIATTFFIGWLPTYLRDQRHLSPDATKWLTSLPMAFGVIACATGGALSDAIIRRTGNRQWGRRINGTIGMAVAAVAIGSTVFVQNTVLLGFLLCLTFVCSDLAMPPAWACCADIGERSAGTLGGAMNMMANVGGAFSAWGAGYLFQRGHPNLVFVFFSVSYVLACLSWLSVDATKPISATPPDRA